MLATLAVLVSLSATASPLLGQAGGAAAGDVELVLAVEVSGCLG